MQNKAQILVVDDDPQVFNLLSLVMQKKGFLCACASTGKEALAKIMGSNSIKLVLLDIVLPDIDGDKLLEKIYSISPSLNVIMITGGSDLEIAKKCLEMGAKDYITKPFDLEYLETSVIADIVPLF
jgi:DNA-binding NtrC family response regulator